MADNGEGEFVVATNSKHERNLDRLFYREEEKKKQEERKKKMSVWDLKIARYEAEHKIRKEAMASKKLGFYAHDLEAAAWIEYHESMKKISKKQLADTMRGNRDFMEEIQVELPPLPKPYKYRVVGPKECKPETIARLLRDLREIRQNPLATVNAQPLGNILTLWHGNLRPMSGPYAGVTFHISLSFPADYPQSPPDLFLYTPIPHPNIFGGYVCCDILSGGSSMKFRGWSSSYTVQSILIQLQTFLTDENIQQGWGADQGNFETVEFVDATKEQVDSFVCPEKECQHSYDYPNPELPPLEVDRNITIKPLGYLLPAPRCDAKNRLNARDKSGKIELSEDGLGMSTTAVKGWWGARSERGYIIAGVFKHTSLYFEVLILGKGVCRIGFSFKGARYNLGKDHNGWGYGGTGKKSHDDVFTDFGSGYRKGDVIGCALDLTKGRIVYFKNGKLEGQAFQVPIDCDGWTFYPTVSIRNNSVRVNFGEKGFRYYPKEFASPRKGDRPGNVEDVFNPYDIEVPFIKKAIEKKKLEEEWKAKRSAEFAALPPEKNPRIPMNDKNYFEILGSDTILSLLEFFEFKDLWRLSRTSKMFHSIVRSHQLFEKLDLKCFNSKHNYLNTVLGHPIRSSRYVAATQVPTPRDPVEKALVDEHMKLEAKLTTTLDVVSYNAYLRGDVNKTVWNVTFGYFLPMIISRRLRHKNQILEILRDNIFRIYHEKLRFFDRSQRSWIFYNSGGSYEPKQAINVLGRLMKSMTSSIFQEAEDENTKRIEAELRKIRWQEKEDEDKEPSMIFMTKNALRGYFSFHHMYLALYEASPELHEAAGNNVIQAFLSRNSFVSLDQQELDELIASAMITKHSWGDIKLKYFEGLCGRWAKRFPSLVLPSVKAKVLSHNMFNELKQTWKSALIQVYFLRNFAKPQNGSIKQLLEVYDMTFAHPTNQQHKELYEFCKKINGFTNWMEVIRCLELDISEEQFLKYLTSSLEKGHLMTL